MDLYRQTRTLTGKTLNIILIRHRTSTVYSALVLPVVASVYLGLGRIFSQPNSKFGFGQPESIRPLGDALALADGGRDTVALVRSGYVGGQIDRVTAAIADIVAGAGKNATVLDSEEELGRVCRSSIRGTSSCFGAVVFHSSPDEGAGGIWNYTLRADGSLGLSFTYDSGRNDAQVYALPLQREVDRIIAGAASFPPTTQQYAYTAKTEDEHQAELRRRYQSAFINYLGVAFIIALIGACYHMPGLMATEREKGLSQLIDAMMPAARGWHRQFARLGSHHAAFTATYAPGWTLAAVVCRIMIWRETSYAILIVFFLLSGIAMTSMSLLGASFFGRAQLSGVICAVACIILGIVAQALTDPGTGAVVVLSLLFTPCSFVFFITYVARYEQVGRATDLLRTAPDSPWNLPGVVLWVFLGAQILVYPVLAACLERSLHGVGTGARSSGPTRTGADVVRVENMTKVYEPSLLRRAFAFISRPRPKVVAVDDLTLTAKRGQILALLGANGSGKSTTLDVVAGISNFTSGHVSVDSSGGLGIAPQKNVLWDELTVEEHIVLFNRLKSPGRYATKEELATLIDAIGLREKKKAAAKTLSGGQKRKLQLGMMLTGGSAVCCVDEVSSGIDPLSRRKIWDILLSERGSRTIIMTTHFLDEADMLADKIAILSKGRLRAEGSSAELKDRFGAGYRVHVLNRRNVEKAPRVDGVEREAGPNSVTYVAPTSSLAVKVIRALDASDIPHQFSGPTIEDVFLNLAAEVKDEEVGDSLQAGPGRPPAHEKCPEGAETAVPSHEDGKGGGQGLLPGRSVGLGQQVLVFLRKRLVVFKTNWVPYVAAFLLPIITAAITQLLVRDEGAVGCRPSDQSRQSSLVDFEKLISSASVVSGPPAGLARLNLSSLLRPLVPGGSGGDGAGAGGADGISFGNATVELVDSLGSFNSFIADNRKKVTPGGWFLGERGSPPTLAFKADKFSMLTAVITQNLLDTMLANTTIATTYSIFDLPVAPFTGQALQLVVYFALACSIFPGLFGLYPNVERRMGIRGLQYSSGARALPTWAAHLVFDFSMMLVSVALAVAIFAASSRVWHNVGYLFPVLMLYALVSILVAYLFSLFCSSSLATYAATSVFHGLGFAVYMIAFLFIVTYSPTADMDRNVLIGHWTISAAFPSGSLIRAFFVTLNTFAAACDGDELRGYPGAMAAFGGPLLYLCVQAALLFSLVVWVESGGGKYATEKAERSEEVDDAEVARELVRVDGPEGRDDGLRVAHLTKAFGKKTIVDNVSFGVAHGQVFALLGPNGAGKSTTISLIRGDMAPSKGGGDVFIDQVSVRKDRALARRSLGVCPQFDAMDSMTVGEHLRHYARIRGIADARGQVEAVVRAVGLDAFVNVMAYSLSGGNKRKLSLAIALTGNPSVMLLDEPSSGLDAAAKRVMWRTLAAVVPGRSILLTTHSMEEADALADRVGILARRMLALGSAAALGGRFGDELRVHLVCKTAPHSTAAETARVRGWVLATFAGAEAERDAFHGQLRFSVPAAAAARPRREGRPGRPGRGDEAAARGEAAMRDEAATRDEARGDAVGRLLAVLEEHKDELGIAHFSVGPTTLNDVFLAIVGQHDVAEEGDGGAAPRRRRPWWKRWAQRRP